MKKHSIFPAIAGGLAVLATTSALANINAVKDLEDNTQVSLSGTVEKVDNEREFTLRDSTGTITVDIESNDSVILQPGKQVTVVGTVDKDVTGTDINAIKVTEHKNVVQAVGDAIEGTTGLSVEGATAYTIGTLPDTGMVKVSGTVSDVDNEKEFTLKDATGSIKVDVKSAEAAALTEGAKVTVIGYVNKGLVSKDLNATKVLITADAGVKQ